MRSEALLVIELIKQRLWRGIDLDAHFVMAGIGHSGRSRWPE